MAFIMSFHIFNWTPDGPHTCEWGNKWPRLISLISNKNLSCRRLRRKPALRLVYISSMGTDLPQYKNIHSFIQPYIHSCSEKAETLITILLFVEFNLKLLFKNKSQLFMARLT